MLKKFINKFVRKTKDERIEGVSRVEVKRTEVDRVKIHKIEPERHEVSSLTMKFRDTVTGEIVHVEFGDHDKFDECMGNKNMQLIFG